jgi:radical SAM superfamily enzyme YgiQ (UPF0313 family)
MSTFDVILVTDTATTNAPKYSRGYGAHRLANHLRTHGYSVLVIDFCSVLTFEYWEEICRYAIGDNTRMVGFSTTWWPYRDQTNLGKINTNTEEFYSLKDEEMRYLSNTFMFGAVSGNARPWIDIVKQKNKKIKIVIGGPKLNWYTDFPADHYVDGFGENQLIDLLSDKRRLWPVVIDHDPSSNGREWGWTTSSTHYTEYDFIQSYEILNLEIARGCKFNCNFCSFPLLGQKELAKYCKTEETLYNELLKNYNDWGITQYNIADDTFNDDIEKLELMVRVTKRLPFKPKFFAYIRVDLIATHPIQIDLLKELGLVRCYIGIESFHPIASKVGGKGMSGDRRKETLYRMNKAWGNNVSIDAGYIVGLPGEPVDYLKEQIDWFTREDCPINHIISFIPLLITPSWSVKFMPTSKIDKDPEKFGYQIPDKTNPNHWVKTDGTDITNYEQASNLAKEFTKQVLARKNIVTFSQMELEEIDPIADYFMPLLERLKR